MYTSIGIAIGGSLGLLIKLCSKEHTVLRPAIGTAVGGLVGVVMDYYKYKQDPDKTIDAYNNFEDFNLDYGCAFLSDLRTHSIRDLPKVYYRDVCFGDQQIFDQFKQNVITFNEQVKNHSIDRSCPEKAGTGHYQYDLIMAQPECVYHEPEGVTFFFGLQLCPPGSYINVPLNGHISCWFYND